MLHSISKAVACQYGSSILGQIVHRPATSPASLFSAVFTPSIRHQSTSGAPNVLPSAEAQPSPSSQSSPVQQPSAEAKPSPKALSLVAQAEEIDRLSSHAGPSTMQSRRRRAAATVPPTSTRSGYMETRRHQSRADDIWAGLKVKLPRKRGENAAMTKPDMSVIQRLIGCLTKDGKKAAAQRVVLDAMEIIRVELEKADQQAGAAAAGSSAPAVSADAANKAGKKQPSKA